MFYWQEDPSKIQQRTEVWRMVEGVDSCCQRHHGGYQCVHFSGKCKQIEKTFGHGGFWKNFQIRVSGQDHLCCGFLGSSNRCLGAVL